MVEKGNKEAKKDKKDVISLVASSVGIPKTKAETVIDAFLAVIKDTVQDGGVVSLSLFGKFYQHKTSAHPGRNPRTGDPVEVSARKSMKFKAATNLRRM